MKYRKIQMLFSILALSLLLTGCTDSSNETKDDSFDDVYESINEENKENKEDTSSNEISDEELYSTNIENFDFDLSKANDSIVYAQAFSVLSDPDSFLSKSFKIPGNFWYGRTGESESAAYLIIIDSSGCCTLPIRLDFSLIAEDMDSKKCFSLVEKRVLVEGRFGGLATPSGLEPCIAVTKLEEVK